MPRAMYPKLTRQQIINEARTWLGTPIHHQARKKGIGVDCVGFVAGVFRNLGCQINDLTCYSRIPQGNTLISKLAEHLVEIDKFEALPGDVLVFARNDEAQHVAFKTDYGMLHAFYTARKVVEHRINYKWRQRLIRAFRYPEII